MKTRNATKNKNKNKKLRINIFEMNSRKLNIVENFRERSKILDSMYLRKQSRVFANYSELYPE